MRREEGVGEGHVHPAQQVGIARGVGLLDAVGVVEAAHAAVQSADAGALAIGLRRVAEGHHGQPLSRPGEPAERVLLVARVLLHAGERRGVQGLHEECPDAADEGGQ